MLPVPSLLFLSLSLLETMRSEAGTGSPERIFDLWGEAWATQHSPVPGPCLPAWQSNHSPAVGPCCHLPALLMKCSPGSALRLQVSPLHPRSRLGTPRILGLHGKKV